MIRSLRRLRSALKLPSVILAAVIGFSSVTPASADQLRVAITSLPPSWGNPFMADGTPSSYVWMALFDGLTRLDSDGDVTPALATKWEQTAPLSWRFELRKNVGFSNGEPFNAAAVAATIRWLQSPEGRITVIGARLRHFDQVIIEDDHTLIITTKTPDAILDKRMTSVPIVAPKAWTSLGPQEFARQPSGTGAYHLERWSEQRRRAYLTANIHSWRKPIVEKLEFIELAETAARVQALISGDVDLAKTGVDEMDLLEARDIRSVIQPSMQVMALALRTVRPDDSPLKDKRVRQALNYAINKDQLAEILLRGYTVASGQPASKTTYGYNPAIKPYPYDPNKARALLKDAGYPNGLPLSIEVVIDSLPADGQIFQALAYDLRQVGIRVDMRAMPFPTFLRNYLSNVWESDAFSLSWSAAPYNDVLRPMENFSCLKRNPFYCDEDLTPLMEKAAETPEPERAEILAKLAQEFHDRAPAIYLVEQLDFFSYRPDISGTRLANRVPEYELITVTRSASSKRR